MQAIQSLALPLLLSPSFLPNSFSLIPLMLSLSVQLSSHVCPSFDYNKDVLGAWAAWRANR